MKVETWKLERIKENPELNPRGIFEGIKGLAESLRTNGQENPLIVATDGTLIGGYRRLAAMRLLGWTECAVQVSSAKPGLEMSIQAGRDNLERASMTTYEVARYFYNLQDRYNLTGQQIADAHKGALGVTGKYVLALCGLIGSKGDVENLAPEIKEQWAKRHPLATTNFLISLKGLPHEEQKAAWSKACEGEQAIAKAGKAVPSWDAEKALEIVSQAKKEKANGRTPAAPTMGADGKPVPEAPKKTRPDTETISRVFNLVTETAGIEDRMKLAARAALLWASGGTPDLLIAGVLVYSAEAEKQEKAKAIEAAKKTKEAEKAMEAVKKAAEANPVVKAALIAAGVIPGTPAAPTAPAAK